MDPLTEIGNITHQYRKQLADIERREGNSEQRTVDNPFRVNGEERAKLERMDADLTAAETLIQRKHNETLALERKVAEMEARLAEPTLRAKPIGKSEAIEDRNSAEFAARWLMAHATKNHAEIRELSTGTTNSAVPTDMERRIVTKMHQASILRQLAKVTTIDSKRTIRIENALPTAYLVGEGASTTQSDPSFSTVSVTPFKYVASTTMTQEFMEDSIGTGGIGTALQYVSDRLGLALAKKMDQDFTIGTNLNEPQGIGDTTSVAWATTNTGRIINQGVQLAEDKLPADITGDNVIDCIHAVPPQYRNSPRFRILTSDSALKAIRKIKTTASGGDYVWKLSETGGLSQGSPGTIFGIPYSVGEYVATTAAATTADIRGNAFFIVGNWDYFEIFDRSGIDSMIDPYSAASTQKSTVYIWARSDSKIMMPEAFAAIYALNAS